MCNGGSATVSAINIGGTAPYTYTWSPNIGTGSGPFSVAPATSTVYTVTIVDANGVSATDTAQVFVNTTPVANAGNDTTVCAGSIVILHGSGATSYQWSGGPATANYTVSPTVTTTYTLTALNGSCSDTETVVITVTPGMNINVIPTAVSCFGGSNGSATATVAGGAPAYTYSWNTTPVQTTATASGLQAGTYTLTVTDQSNCINSVSVSINEPPAFTVNLNGDTSICAGESSTLTATVNGGVNPYTYTWNNSLPTGNPQMVSPTQTTTYIVTAHDHNACTATKQITVNVAQKPIIAFTKADSGCVPHTAVFINATQNAATYLWRFGDGTTSVLNSPLHVYSLAGVYSVTLIADNNGCIDSLKKPGYIHVFPQAKAALTATPAIVSEIYPEIVIDNLSTGQDHCELYFGDGVMSNNCNDLSHIYPAVGTYTITLMAITNEGCNDTTSIQITIEPETTFFIPEAFSPNADGHNELFMAFGTNINSFQIVIFNRWGNMVYTGNDLGKGWDGNINGNKAPEDVYVYKVTYTDYKDRKHNLKGRFSLIR